MFQRLIYFSANYLVHINSEQLYFQVYAVAIVTGPRSMSTEDTSSESSITFSSHSSTTYGSMGNNENGANHHSTSGKLLSAIF